MNESTKNKLKAILLSATAALLSTNAKAEEPDKGFPILEDNGNVSSSRIGRWKRIYQNVAKVDANGDVKLIASHRSHMSHRSGGGGRSGGHYSHASHYSSYGGSGSGYSSSSSRRSSSSSSSYSKPRAKTPGEYSYGDRTLKSGLYGSDVTTLTGYLAMALYINRANIKQKEGYSLYDETIASAIKHFQKDAGLKQTGVADSETLTSLKNWDSRKTTVILGTRDLSFSENGTTSGTDVTELVNLLSKAGFPPDPSKIIMNDDKTEFTKDIEIAVKLFQAYNGLTVNGIVNSETLKLLRAKAK